MRKMFVIFAAIAVLSVCAFPALAAPADDFDYLQFASNQVLHALHPTSNSEKATSEYLQPPTRDGEIVTAQVRVFYKGWVKKHELVAEIQMMEAPAGDMIKVEVVSDTNSTKLGQTAPFMGKWAMVADLK